MAKDSNLERCRNNQLPDERFCILHLYMNDYTDSMLEKMTLCISCKKMKYLENDKTCEKCKERSNKNKEIKKNKLVLCEKNGCKFKRSIENKYCNKHQIWIFIDETEELGKKTCANYVRGCRSQLDIHYQYSRCGDCLQNDRNRDNERRGSVRSNNIVTGNTKVCTTCCKELSLDHFQGIKGDVKTCDSCREQNKIQDSKRNKEHRNEIARKNDAKPERIEVKNKWKEDNYEKVAETWMNSRQNKIERIGIDDYQKQNTEQAKKWRENNPEKVLQSNEDRKKNLKICYGNYIRSARDKNLDFSISFEDYKEIVCGNCYYCGTIADKGFNGIDRKDQTMGYIIDNCVNCCQMCNYMKGSLNDIVFVKMVEHILTHNKIIKNGNLYPEIFANHIYGINFRTYRYRANDKKFDFEITEQQFNEITTKDCYICGKKKSSEHRNGIDRYDSKLGYLFENCRSCCGECNYLKREYDYDNFIDKLKSINNNFINPSFLYLELFVKYLLINM